MVEFTEKNDIRACRNHQEILQLQPMCSDIWIKVSGTAELNDTQIPDDLPLPKYLYIGPFSLFDYNL